MVTILCAVIMASRCSYFAFTVSLPLASSGHNAHMHPACAPYKPVHIAVYAYAHVQEIVPSTVYEYSSMRVRVRELSYQLPGIVPE